MVLGRAYQLDKSSTLETAKREKTLKSTMLKAKRYESQPAKPNRSRSLQLVAKCGFNCFQLSEHVQQILGSRKSVD